jgi:putative phosphoribosyl transferase
LNNYNREAVKNHYKEELDIPAGNEKLKANLTLPDGTGEIVVFAHGSGSSRLSSRNVAVAQKLNDQHFGTLLFDLLTEEEDREYNNRFDITLLTERLIAVSEWLNHYNKAEGLRLGYFGASTGAAAALMAAAHLPVVNAVVSRGGRPDLASAKLSKVYVPVLLIVGGLDKDVLDLNNKGMLQLAGIKHLEIVAGATHLFEETGTMDEVIKLATDWFSKYLRISTINENI